MKDKKVEVSSYAGHRGEESPRSFILEGERIEVLSVLRMWVEEDSKSRARKRFFRLRGSDGLERTLYQEEESLHWSIRTS